LYEIYAEVALLLVSLIIYYHVSRCIEQFIINEMLQESFPNFFFGENAINFT